ncbi:MAG: MFS transporter [Lachnospiraceae bacterium]|nr:MFS transporter [Lachnospiraceae bacterium]
MRNRKDTSKKMWSRNFLMVVIGQIISLFGNAVLRFALPLYLLNETGSAALFGVVSACAFIPMIVLSPVGGIFADRVNKRNIMVVLDFSTAILVFGVIVLLGKMNLVALLLGAMFLLYGIQGAYQPAVQASMPALLAEEHIMQGNAVINLVSSFSGLIGPVVGGALFGFYGIMPILYVSVVCFVLSAVMEIFIQIPYEKKQAQGNIFAIGFGDLKESFHYMSKEQPLIMRLSFAVAAINMILSALMIIGMPVIVTQMLAFDSETANRLYGYAEGIMAMGSLCGGIGAGVFAGKIKTKNGYLLLFFDALTLIPIGVALLLPIPAMVAYVVILASCFVMMFLATLFSIQLMSYLQIIVPSELIGKVISCAMCIGMCASPIGQAIYGALFEGMRNGIYLVFYAAAALTVLLAFGLKKSFVELEQIVDGKESENMHKKTA